MCVITDRVTALREEVGDDCVTITQLVAVAMAAATEVGDTVVSVLVVRGQFRIETAKRGAENPIWA